MRNILMVTDDREQFEKINLIKESKQHCHFYCATAAGGALEMIARQTMDLIILDTELRDQPGLELAQKIRTIPGYEFVWIILVGSQQYETDAYKKTHCYNFIVKPYDVEVLFSIVEKLSSYKTMVLSEEDKKYVTFKQRDKYIRVLAKDILYIEVIGNNSTMYTYSNIYSLKKMSLQKLKLVLPDYFVRCHKSFIVNRNYIEAIQKSPYGWEIRLKNYDTPLPNGEKYKDNLKKFAQIS